MSGDQVKTFVTALLLSVGLFICVCIFSWCRFIDRYILAYTSSSVIENGYEPQLDKSEENSSISHGSSSNSNFNTVTWKPSWLGKCLKVTIVGDRNVVGMANF